MSSFAELPWHDALLVDIHVDRRDPGNTDEVMIEVHWPDRSSDRVRFIHCYACDMRMNFGVVASETVREAQELAHTDKLDEMRGTWGRIGVDLTALRCFRIETNSTASVLEIYALEWVRERVT